jgi:hypothetical protein
MRASPMITLVTDKAALYPSDVRTSSRPGEYPEDR